MRTLDSRPDEVLVRSIAMRQHDERSRRIRLEQLGDVAVPSGALYLGPRSGTNGTDGVVVRVPAGTYRVIASVDEESGALRALTVELDGAPESLRDALPGAAYWHDAPGALPIVPGDELAISDAALRDQHAGGSFPWQGWLRDIVDPALHAARASGRAGVAVPYPDRSESIVAAAKLEGEVVLFAGFSEAGRPTAIHLDPLTAAADTATAADSAAPATAVFGPIVRDANDEDERTERADVDVPATADADADASADVLAGADPDAPAPATLGPVPPPADAPAVNDASTAHEEPSAEEERSFDEMPAAAAPSDENRGDDAPTDEPRSDEFDVPETGIDPAHHAAAEAEGNDAAPVQGAGTTEPEDEDAARLMADVRAGLEHADRGDRANAVTLLTRVTDALATPFGDRASVRTILARNEVSGAQLVDVLADAHEDDGRADLAMRALAAALDSPHLGANELETLHLRRRLGELQLRAGDIGTATATLERAHNEAEALANRSGPDPDGAVDFGRDYLAHVTFDLADASLQSGQAAPAAEIALDAMRKFEELRLARMAGRSAFLAASAYGALEHEASRQHAVAEAERVFRLGGELDGQGTALGFLGEADALRGEYNAALAKFEEARRVLIEAGELTNASIAAENEAVCLEHLGDREEAARRRVIAQQLAQRAGNA